MTRHRCGYPVACCNGRAQPSRSRSAEYGANCEGDHDESRSDPHTHRHCLGVDCEGQTAAGEECPDSADYADPLGSLESDQKAGCIGLIETHGRSDVTWHQKFVAEPGGGKSDVEDLQRNDQPGDFRLEETMDDVSSVKASLTARRAQLAAELDRLTEPPKEGASVGFGKRVGDGTTEAVERLATTATARSINNSISEIDTALSAIEDGSYGVCKDCGEEIPAARLEARPATSKCVDCAS